MGRDFRTRQSRRRGRRYRGTADRGRPRADRGDAHSARDLAYARVPGRRERRQAHAQSAVPRQCAAQARGRQRANASGRQPGDGPYVHREPAECGGNLAAVLDPSADRGANPSARANGRVGTGWTRLMVHSMEEGDDKRGFKVQDRRRFSAEGETRPGEEAPQASSEAIDIKTKPEPVAPEATASPQASAHSHSAGSRHEAPPELTFPAFLWSLSEQALAALGEVPDPTTGKVSHDLIMAQQMIDII